MELSIIYLHSILYIKNVSSLREKYSYKKLINYLIHRTRYEKDKLQGVESIRVPMNFKHDYVKFLTFSKFFRNNK